MNLEQITKITGGPLKGGIPKGKNTKSLQGLLMIIGGIGLLWWMNSIMNKMNGLNVLVMDNSDRIKKIENKYSTKKKPKDKKSA